MLVSGPGLAQDSGPRTAGLPDRVMSSAWAAASAVNSPAPGGARGRPRGRTLPGYVRGHRCDRESRPLRSATIMERCLPPRVARLVARRSG